MTAQALMREAFRADVLEAQDRAEELYRSLDLSKPPSRYGLEPGELARAHHFARTAYDALFALRVMLEGQG